MNVFNVRVTNNKGVGAGWLKYGPVEMAFLPEGVNPLTLIQDTVDAARLTFWEVKTVKHMFWGLKQRGQLDWSVTHEEAGTAEGAIING